jgi:hypothetical protein
MVLVCRHGLIWSNGFDGFRQAARKNFQPPTSVSRRSRKRRSGSPCQGGGAVKRLGLLDPPRTQQSENCRFRCIQTTRTCSGFRPKGERHLV